jgi:hypothetical protein
MILSWDVVALKDAFPISFRYVLFFSMKFYLGDFEGFPPLLLLKDSLIFLVNS